MKFFKYFQANGKKILLMIRKEYKMNMFECNSGYNVLWYK